MFSKIRSRIAPDIGIDLGAMNTRVFVKGKGVVLEVPTVVAIQTYSKRVLAVGDDAKEMLGRTPGEIVVVYPLKGGVIADYDLTEAFLRYVLEKVFTRPWWASCFKPRAVIAVPSGITEVEKCAVETAAHAAGVGEVFLIERPMAAAIGAGLPVSAPRGYMIVDIGASTCDVAVISLAGIVHIVSERAASGDAMDECIQNHMRQAHRLLVDEQTAEAAKRMVGSACSVDSEPNMDVCGRDVVIDDVKTVKVTAEEIRGALAKPVSRLVAIVRQIRELCEPKLATDIADCGIVLTGGGSLLRGLDKFLSKEVRIPVRLADNPMAATVEGVGVVLEEIDFLAKNRKAGKKLKVFSAIVGLMAVAAIGFCAWRSGAHSLGDAKQLLGSSYEVEPKNAELLYDAGNCALFAGETESDAVFNAAVRKADSECPDVCNSLFLRQKTKEGTNIWRLVMTSGGGWKDADGMSEWCTDRAGDIRTCFFVMKARISADGRDIWLVCDPHTSTCFLVCRYNFDDNSFRVLCDGDTADEQADGTILIKNKKTYLYDEKGVSLGAAWYDEWIDPDGKVVRKTMPSRKMLEK